MVFRHQNRWYECFCRVGSSAEPTIRGALPRPLRGYISAWHCDRSRNIRTAVCKMEYENISPPLPFFILLTKLRKKTENGKLLVKSLGRLEWLVVIVDGTNRGNICPSPEAEQTESGEQKIEIRRENTNPDKNKKTKTDQLSFHDWTRPAPEAERWPKWGCCNRRLLALADDGLKILFSKTIIWQRQRFAIANNSHTQISHPKRLRLTEPPSATKKRETIFRLSLVSCGRRIDCATLVFNLSRLGIVCKPTLLSLLGLSEPPVLVLLLPRRQNKKRTSRWPVLFSFSCGRRTRTSDLRVMSPAS